MNMPFGKFEGLPLSDKSIPTWYLVKLEEDMLLRGRNTSEPLMRALDAEIKSRKAPKAKTYAQRIS